MQTLSFYDQSLKRVVNENLQMMKFMKMQAEAKKEEAAEEDMAEDE